MKTTTAFTIDADTITAHITTKSDGDLAFYMISSDDFDGGTILAQPARLGMHPDHGVMVTLGGYSGHVDLGDFAVRGSVTCTGADMRPGPTHCASQYPIGQVRKDNPDMADYLCDLVTAIATDYAARYTGRGLR